MSPVNPILPGMHPDPSICRVDGVYYLVTSTFEYLPGLPIHSSTDLANWTLIGHAIHDQFDFAGAGDSRGMFAPTIRHHDGLFIIACTLMAEGEPSGSFYVTAQDAAGPWSQPVMLPEARGIDPSLFFHEGRVWWLGCREVTEPSFDGETEIWMRELDLDRGELVGEETVIWTRTQARAVWAEGPHLYHRGGWFYLVTAEGGTGFEHSVMVARSREPGGPYEPCPRNPVLTHRHLGHGVEVQNVGHADLVEADDGQWWMTVLATRPISGHHILGRETHLARVDWEDGWPVVNPGLGRLDAPIARGGRWGSDGVPSASDFLAVRRLPDFAESAPSGLLLRSTGSSPSAASLLRRLTSTDCTVSVRVEVLDEAAAGGLMLRQSDEVHVRVEVAASAEGLRVELLPRERETARVVLPSGPVVLSAEVTPVGVHWAAAGEGQASVSLGSTPLSALSSETAGGFVGTIFGPYVCGPAGARLQFSAWSQEDRA